MPGLVTRFAPSPTGRLHLGHAFSALTAWNIAENSGGSFELRIEDIDTGRSRPEFEEAIVEDLAWLGLRWPKPLWRQSDRLPAYATALERLKVTGLAYPCTCSRRDITAALSAPQEGAADFDPPVYPGTCRGRTDDPPGAAWRLDLAAAIARLGGVRTTTSEALSVSIAGLVVLVVAAWVVMGPDPDRARPGPSAVP